MSPSWPKPSSSVSKSHSSPYFSRIASANGVSVPNPVTRSAFPSTTTSSPSFHVFTPVVTATAVDAARFCAFCSSGPVQNTKACPSWLSTHAPTSGVMCGRPSLRTVVSQYSSAAARTSLTCRQLTGSVASLKLVSSLPLIAIPIRTGDAAKKCIPLQNDGGRLNSISVSKNPLRRLSETLLLASMRPPLADQLLRRRAVSVDLAGKRVLITGASSGIGEAGAGSSPPRARRVIVVARRQELLDARRRTHHRGRRRRRPRSPCDLSDLDAVDDLVANVDGPVGGVDILVNNAGRSIRRPLAESLDRWHDVERTMTLNYYSPLRLIRGLAPGMSERGDGHIINVSTWGVLHESSPLFAVYNASKAALTAVSRVIETEWAATGVHSTTLYYPLVKTPMIAPTRAYDGLPGAAADEAADWMITAARRRPVRIAPRMAVTAHALNSFAPGAVDAVMKRQRVQPTG